MRPFDRSEGRSPAAWGRWREAGGALAVGLLLGLAACGTGTPPPDIAPPVAAVADTAGVPELASSDPVPVQRAARATLLATGALPPIPEVLGELRLRVQYPPRGARVGAEDSTFLFGSVGTGDASLVINGSPVPVEPNGAFLAWMPLPPRSNGEQAEYLLVARRGPEVDTLRHAVRLPPEPFVGEGELWIDPGALAEPPIRWALPDETLAFAVRGAPGLRVWLEVGGERTFLSEFGETGAGARPASDPGFTAGEDAVGVASTYRASLPARFLWEAACRTVAWADGDRPRCGAAASDSAPAADSLPVTLAAAAGWDTLRLDRHLRLRLLSPGSLPAFMLREAPDSINGSAGVVVGRPTPSGPYRWRFPVGTRVQVDGRVADRLRVRLGRGSHAWVAAEDAVPLVAAAEPALLTVGDVRVEPAADRLILRVGVDAAVPLQVTQPDPRTLAVTLFGVHGHTNRMAYGAAEPLLESLRWEQLPDDRYRLIVRLAAPVWGYRAAWDGGDADQYEGPRGDSGSGTGGGDSASGASGGDSRSAAAPADPILRLEVRRPPRLDPARPLRGLRVAVDPGHPGGGSRGPTGYFEGDANLAVARSLAERLRAEGAEPVLTRTDRDAVGLYERTARARAAGAHLFVSIHNNALPDGVRPFGREGTSTYYHHPHSRELAVAVQAGMLREMRLRDLGVLWGDLAVARETWMPAVLAEGAFMMMPRHEAALRTEEFQDRYARGVLRGIEAFVRERTGR